MRMDGTRDTILHFDVKFRQCIFIINGSLTDVSYCCCLYHVTYKKSFNCLVLLKTKRVEHPKTDGIGRKREKGEWRMEKKERCPMYVSYLWCTTSTVGTSDRINMSTSLFRTSTISTLFGLFKNESAHHENKSLEKLAMMNTRMDEIQKNASGTAIN